MAETRENVQTANNVAKTEPSKKRVKVGFIFLAFLPTAVLLMIQSVSQIPFIFLAFADMMKGETDVTSLDGAMDASQALMKIFSEKYAFYAYLIYAAIGLTVFSIWYYKGFVKKNPKVKLSQVFGVKSILAAVGMIIGFYFAINAALILIDQLLPELMESYTKLMETAGLGSNDIITIVYAIALGPVLEELVYRGVTFGLLEKSGIRPGLIILISGILFGLVHMNPVQSTYAAILGFMLGFLRYKYRSIKITILGHFLLNVTGTYGEQLLHSFGLSNAIYLILGGIALFVIVFCVVLVNGDKKAYKASNSGTEQLN